MNRHTTFGSPYLLGFEHLERLLERTARTAGEAYPPYNIEGLEDGGIRITLAVAGFSLEELSVTEEDRQLVVRGRQAEADGKTFRRKTPFVFVGNNEYEMDLFNIGRRPAVDKGNLSIYFLHHGGRSGVVMLLLRTLTGSVRQWHEFEAVVTSEATIETRRGLMPVALDGEVAALETPLVYKSLPQSLTVIVPELEEPT
jgi:hypothetical protein